MRAGKYRVVNGNSNLVICESAVCAVTLAERARGLLGRPGLASDEGLLIVSPSWLPLMWLHTFGMRFAIDMIFMDAQLRVLKMNANVRPRRVSSIVPGARYALETASGTIAKSGTQCGDKLNLAHLGIIGPNVDARLLYNILDTVDESWTLTRGL